MSKTRTLIIAEAGVNHNGDKELAHDLIDVAYKAGVDIVKFQTFKADSLVTSSARKANYQTDGSNNNETQFEMLKKLEISKEDHFELLDHCKKLKVEFLSTAFDLESLAFLQKLSMARYKIPSGEITNLPYLEMIGKLGKPVILSTGMANLSEIEAAVNVLLQNGIDREQLTLLHCNTEYPTPYQDVNLKAMLTLQIAFGVNVGYSDHTAGIEVAIAAVALGASVIEKHFTLDKSLPGPDHKASLDPNELRNMVTSIRNIESALGDGIKKPSPSEIKNIEVARKSLVASCDIKLGEVFSSENVTVKRPGYGLSPMRYYEVLGKIAKQNFSEDDLIEI